VVQAAKSRGIAMEPIAGIRPDQLVRLPRALGHAVIWLAARRRPDQKTGMIALLRERRPVGIDDLNALIDAPLNRALARQVREIEAGKRDITPRNFSELT
jgi:hypothetical protein